MNKTSKTKRIVAAQLAALGIATLGVMTLAACASGGGGGDSGWKLSSAQEVPANPSTATGVADITVGPDKSVSGRVSTSGIVSTAAHIHEAAAGKNGPVIVPLVKAGDDGYAVPPNAKLTDAQYASYQAGNLYVNVHSAAYPGGEIRAQLTPKASAYSSSPAPASPTKSAY